MAELEIRAGLAEIDTFDVIGISIMTDNQKGTDDINALWEQFFSKSVGQSVTNKVNDIIYAVYSDYEGDHEDPYKLTIGYRVKEGTDTPKGMHRVQIPGQEYAIMSATGEQPKALIETWQAIWGGELPRSYKCDFEVYGPRFFEDGIHEVLIHIGVDGDALESEERI